jgi:hypothetical protein
MNTQTRRGYAARNADGTVVSGGAFAAALKDEAPGLPVKPAIPVHEYVDPYPGRKGSDRIERECSACGGDGRYKHSSGYVTNLYYRDGSSETVKLCFGCNGSGKYSFLVSSARAKERRAVRRRNDAEIRADEYRQEALAEEALMDEWREINADFVAGAREFSARSSFLEDLSAQVADGRQLSEKQLAAGLLTVAKIRDEIANAQPVPTGRQEIQGIVLTTRWQDNDYGSGQMKMLLKAQGYKLWGTIPSSDVRVRRGDEIALTGTLEPSEDDPYYGFFKRPAKLRMIQEADHSEDEDD